MDKHKGPHQSYLYTGPQLYNHYSFLFNNYHTFDFYQIKVFKRFHYSWYQSQPYRSVWNLWGSHDIIRRTILWAVIHHNTQPSYHFIIHCTTYSPVVICCTTQPSIILQVHLQLIDQRSINLVNSEIMEYSQKKSRPNDEMNQELHSHREELYYLKSCLDSLEKGQGNLQATLSGNNNSSQNKENS